jgi:SAM-dependent methyltransferase
VTAADSYRRHRNEWEREASDGARVDFLRSWLRNDTIDSWRHDRKYEAVNAFADFPEFTWLTVGDGRFGLDSIRLRRLGVKSVLPTDIGDALLKQAKDEGLIDDYATENAESMSFGDNAFDIVFCKESYHHFPRPHVALYEMIRVAREAVILIEPRDYVIDHGPNKTVGPLGLLGGLIRWIRDRLNVVGGRSPVADRYTTGDVPAFEESGNYLYATSSRELEKVALGLNMPCVAFKGLNDEYVSGGEGETASESSATFRDLRARIAAADQRTAEGRGSSTLLMAILFKARPQTRVAEFLRSNDWLVLDLPPNPYVTSSEPSAG